MHECEIRILHADRRPAIITCEIHLNDHSAIRSARKLANGKRVEVWRGLDCIYGSDTAPQPTSRPPDHSTA